MRLFAAAALLVLASCASRDPVEALLDDVVDAAEHRDAGDLGELLASDFTAGDGSDRAASLATARRFLIAYKALDVDLSKVEIHREGGTARAKFRADISGVPTDFAGLGDLVPKHATYDFDVTAREEGGRWKLVTATWSVPSE